MISAAIKFHAEYLVVWNVPIKRTVEQLQETHVFVQSVFLKIQHISTTDDTTNVLKRNKIKFKTTVTERKAVLHLSTHNLHIIVSSTIM